MVVIGVKFSTENSEYAGLLDSPSCNESASMLFEVSEGVVDTKINGPWKVRGRPFIHMDSEPSLRQGINNMALRHRFSCKAFVFERKPS